MEFKFENLRVWQLAIDLTVDVNNLTKKFPVGEKYVLAQQMQRAADSIALNIAEGSTGQTNAEYKRFLSFSIRSGIEVVSCLISVENEILLMSKNLSPCMKSVIH